MLPGREPWEAVRCACGSVLGAARVYPGGNAQVRVGTATGVRDAHSPCPGGPGNTPDGSGEGGEERRGGGCRDVPGGGAPLVHLYPHRVKLAAVMSGSNAQSLAWR